MQPTFFPWIGYFDMIDHVDRFIFLDDAQLVKRSWGVRNRIKSNNGQLYLTMPVKKTGSRDDTLYANALISEDEKWRKKHLSAFLHCYKKSPFYQEVFPILESVYHAPVNLVSEFNISVIKALCEYMSIDTPFGLSSKIEGVTGTRDERLVSICKQVGTKQYLAAFGSSDYIEKENEAGAFKNSGVELLYHNYLHPEYNQLFGEFISYLSVVDLLFNCGPEESLKIIRKGRKQPLTPAEIRIDLNSK